jgi:CoA:oxalate CoA-transferase
MRPPRLARSRFAAYIAVLRDRAWCAGREGVTMSMKSGGPASADRPRPPGPLAGYVVLDLTRVLSGPYCTMILADLGATVIKVEQPGSGDDSRGFLPFINGESAFFASVNRGKKSIALDLKLAPDRAIFASLLPRVDVLVENFRPGVLGKMGYGWEVLEQAHPRLVLASISGFGQSGPYREKGAYDPVVVAMSGLMSITGFPGMPPARPGTSIGDLGAALFAANGIQAALLQRARTGRGSQVDVAMLECQIALLEMGIARTLADGVSPGPLGAGHPGSAPYDAFRAADGYVVICAGADGLFAALAGLLGHPDWVGDARFVDRKSRVANQALLKSAIEAKLAEAPVAEWLVRFDRAGIPAGPVNNIAAMMADPQVRSRGVILDVEGSAGLKAAATPVLLSGFGYPDRLPPAPAIDEHRAEILRFAAGVDFA